MRLITYFGVLMTVLLGVWSCIDLNLDEPPVTGLPNLTPNTTIRELKSLHNVGQDDQLIQSDAIIYGVVIADDESGNFYKKIVIQDETGGIVIRMNAIGLYNSFPVGREVFVKCKGLYIGDEAGVILLNGSPDTPIEEALIPEYVFGGARNRILKPDTIPLIALNESRISTLIHLRDVQFIEPDTGLAFSDVISREDSDRIVADCGGNNIVIHTSGYAKFGYQTTPQERGGVTGVYGVNWKTPQLYLRGMEDLEMDQGRCGIGGQDPVLISIRDLRDAHSNAVTVVPPYQKIQGVVISDRENGNINSRNLFIQDGEWGIALQFRENHSFSLNEELEVNVSRLALTEIDGLLHVTDISLDRVVSMGEGTPPTPRAATIEQVKGNLDLWESTLVRLEDVEVEAAGSVWSGRHPLVDPSGSAYIRTLSTASFAQETPPDEKVKLSVIVSQAGDLEFLIRNLDDVEVPPDPNGPFTEIDEPFTSQPDGRDVSIPGWRNIAVKGSRRWVAREFNGNLYAQATAFNDENNEMETWLITPAISLDEMRILSFRSAQAFYQHAGLSVWISKDYDGTNFNMATWTELDCRIAESDDGQNEWIDSGDIDLAPYQGTVHIGFRYVGNNGTKTTTFRIDDVRIRKP